MMPLKGYFLWMGLALAVALYGASLALGNYEIKPSGAQDIPKAVQKLRAQQAKAAPMIVVASGTARKRIEPVARAGEY